MGPGNQGTAGFHERLEALHFLPHLYLEQEFPEGSPSHRSHSASPPCKAGSAGSALPVHGQPWRSSSCSHKQLFTRGENAQGAWPLACAFQSPPGPLFRSWFFFHPPNLMPYFIPQSLFYSEATNTTSAPSIPTDNLVSSPGGRGQTQVS